MWDLIVSVPGHCFSFYFSHDEAQIITHIWSQAHKAGGWKAAPQANQDQDSLLLSVCVEVLQPCQQLRLCRASHLPINTVPGQGQDHNISECPPK